MLLTRTQWSGSAQGVSLTTPIRTRLGTSRQSGGFHVLRVNHVQAKSRAHDHRRRKRILQARGECLGCRPEACSSAGLENPLGVRSRLTHTARPIVDCEPVSGHGRQDPSEILVTLTKLSGISLATLQSPTQLRRIGDVRAAAAHLLRNESGLLVKQVASLLGRSDQTVCELSRKARLALVSGGRIAELIGQTSLMLGATTQEPLSTRSTERDAPR